MVRFIPNRQGYREVLNGREMFAVCDRVAAGTANKLGYGYTHDTIHGLHRIHAQVKTTGGGAWKERVGHGLRHVIPDRP